MCLDIVGSKSPTTRAGNISSGHGMLEDYELTSDSRELGQIVNNSIRCMDVIIHEWSSAVLALSSQDGNSGKSHQGGPNNFLRTIRSVLGLFLCRIHR